MSESVFLHSRYIQQIDIPDTCELGILYTLTLVTCMCHSAIILNVVVSGCQSVMTQSGLELLPPVPLILAVGIWQPVYLLLSAQKLNLYAG